MPSRIIYLPIEQYDSRYTQYSDSPGGIYETCFEELGIKFHTLRPHNNLLTIKQGQVLDVYERTSWGFKQILELVDMICSKEINPVEDVIFLGDFWTPGFEQIMYAQSSVFGANPADHAKVYSFCHADSWDRNDFTAAWKWWIQPLEKAWFDYQHTIFCAAREMIPMMAEAGVNLLHARRVKCVPVGHAFHKETMLVKASRSSVPPISWGNRKKQVVFASRFDTEKNPEFFFDFAMEVMNERDDITFVVCTGQPELTSNDPEILNTVKNLHSDFDNQFKILQGLSLNHYYSILAESRVLFNCAKQDFISYVLLDATINGCAPLFPEWLTFPDALNHDDRFLYKNVNLSDAKKKLYALMNPKDEIDEMDLYPIYSKYEDTVKRMVKIMGFDI